MVNVCYKNSPGKATHRDYRPMVLFRPKWPDPGVGSHVDGSFFLQGLSHPDLGTTVKCCTSVLGE